MPRNANRQTGCTEFDHREGTARRGSCPLHLCGSRIDAVESERLIDVEEWCELHDLSMPLAFPAVMTAGLCDAIERIPFGWLGRASAAQRGAELFRRAAAAISRRLSALDAPDSREARDPDGGVRVSFAAPLACSAEERSWRFVCVHLGMAGDTPCVLTLGLPDEFCQCVQASPEPAEGERGSAAPARPQPPVHPRTTTGRRTPWMRRRCAALGRALALLLPLALVAGGACQAHANEPPDAPAAALHPALEKDSASRIEALGSGFEPEIGVGRQLRGIRGIGLPGSALGAASFSSTRFDPDGRRSISAWSSAIAPSASGTCSVFPAASLLS
jgi:hypothetical protein